MTWTGSSWSQPTTIDPGNHLSSVSCSSASSCVAVDNEGNEVTWNGDNWSAPASVDGGGAGMSSVSCAAPSVCRAGGSDGYVFEDAS